MVCVRFAAFADVNNWAALRVMRVRSINNDPAVNRSDFMPKIPEIGVPGISVPMILWAADTTSEFSKRAASHAVAWLAYC